MRTLRSQSGFGIVEVMVALVVLAVGMLGIASLYVTTLRDSNSAISRMQAVNLVADMADRIRANRFAGAAYETAPGDATSQECSGEKNCDRDEMAENDLYLWQLQINELLPGNATPSIVYAAGAANEPDTYTITMDWREPNTEEVLRYRLAVQVEP